MKLYWLPAMQVMYKIVLVNTCGTIKSYYRANNGSFEPKTMIRKYKLCSKFFFDFFSIFFEFFLKNRFEFFEFFEKIFFEKWTTLYWQLIEAFHCSILIDDFQVIESNFDFATLATYKMSFEFLRASGRRHGVLGYPKQSATVLVGSVLK
jgi:hypothetical protein